MAPHQNVKFPQQESYQNYNQGPYGGSQNYGYQPDHGNQPPHGFQPTAQDVVTTVQQLVGDFSKSVLSVTESTNVKSDGFDSIDDASNALGGHVASTEVTKAFTEHVEKATTEQYNYEEIFGSTVNGILDPQHATHGEEEGTPYLALLVTLGVLVLVAILVLSVYFYRRRSSSGQLPIHGTNYGSSSECDPPAAKGKASGVKK